MYKWYTAIVSLLPAEQEGHAEWECEPKASGNEEKYLGRYVQITHPLFGNATQNNQAFTL